MILTIRTDKPEAELGLFKGIEKADYVTWQAHKELSITILSKIEELLKSNSLTAEDLSGVVVFRGPGSYTGLRIGITVANAFAYSLSIPISGSTGDDWIETGIAQLGDDSQKFVSPEYGGSAHITKPRK